MSHIAFCKERPSLSGSSSGKYRILQINGSGIAFACLSSTFSWGEVKFFTLAYIAFCDQTLHMLLKVVGHYDLIVLSMSVMGFQKISSLDKGGGGDWGELYPFCVCGILLLLDNWRVLEKSNGHM